MRVFNFNKDYSIQFNATKNETERFKNGEIFGPIPILLGPGHYIGKDAFVRFGKSEKNSIEITNYDPENFEGLTQLYFLITEKPLETMKKEERPVSTRYRNNNKITIYEVFEQDE